MINLAKASLRMHSVRVKDHLMGAGTLLFLKATPVTYDEVVLVVPGIV